MTEQFYTALVFPLFTAATNGRQHHACVILDSDGNTVAQYGYTNEVVEEGE